MKVNKSGCVVTKIYKCIWCGCKFSFSKKDVILTLGGNYVLTCPECSGEHKINKIYKAIIKRKKNKRK